MDKDFKVWLISTYCMIGLLYAIYQHFWGQYNYKPFFYNVGQGLFWPIMMFPTVGKIISGLLIVGIVFYLMFSKRS